MLYEHRVARSLIQHMREALGESGSDVDSIDETEFRNAATSYLDLMRQHIAKENNILFEIGDQVMTEEDQLALGESFCTVACQSFGGKRTEELEAIAGELEARWSPAA
jgi:hemerythrin-like domain-containing protein